MRLNTVRRSSLLRLYSSLRHCVFNDLILALSTVFSWTRDCDVCSPSHTRSLLHPVLPASALSTPPQLLPAIKYV